MKIYLTVSYPASTSWQLIKERRKKKISRLRFHKMSAVDLSNTELISLSVVGSLRSNNTGLSLWHLEYLVERLPSRLQHNLKPTYLARGLCGSSHIWTHSPTQAAVACLMPLWSGSWPGGECWPLCTEPTVHDPG